MIYLDINILMNNTFDIDNYTIIIILHDDNINIKVTEYSEDDKYIKYSKIFNNTDIKLTFSLLNIYKIISQAFEKNKDFIIQKYNDIMEIIFNIIIEDIPINFNIKMPKKKINELENKIYKLEEENFEIKSKLQNLKSKLLESEDKISKLDKTNLFSNK